MNAFDWLTIIVAVFLIIAVLLTVSDDDINDAFSGSKSDLFKNKKARGFELYIKIASGVLSFLLLLFVVLANVIR